jgi:hypothetical protein
MNSLFLKKTVCVFRMNSHRIQHLLVRIGYMTGAGCLLAMLSARTQHVQAPPLFIAPSIEHLPVAATTPPIEPILSEIRAFPPTGLFPVIWIRDSSIAGSGQSGVVISFQRRTQKEFAKKLFSKMMY